MTSGRETQNSSPSRRISSIRIARCSSPRPITFTPSERPRSSMRIATLMRSSRCRRSFIWRSMMAVPSFPEKGPVLTRKNIDTVGSSISRGLSASAGSSIFEKVSPMPISAGPASQTISPALILSASTRSSPRVTQKCTPRSLVDAGHVPAGVLIAGILPLRDEPGEFIPLVQRAAQHPAAADLPDIIAPGERADLHEKRTRPGRPWAAERSRTIVSKRASIPSCASLSRSLTNQPSRPEPYRTGKCACSSVAPRSRKQIERLVQRVIGAGVRTIDFVDDRRSGAGPDEASA